MQSITTNRKPLEVLVISQLADIKKHEAALQQQLRSTAADQVGTFAAAISQLKDRADRLGRMLDAMEIACPDPAFVRLTH